MSFSGERPLGEQINFEYCFIYTFVWVRIRLASYIYHFEIFNAKVSIVNTLLLRAFLQIIYNLRKKKKKTAICPF